MPHDRCAGRRVPAPLDHELDEAVLVQEAALDAVRESTVSEPFDAGFAQRAAARMQSLQPWVTKGGPTGVDGWRSHARPLLAGAGDGSDATRAQQLWAAALSQAAQPGWALLRPALAPACPDPSSPRLFHVSAFRDGRLPAQAVLRGTCKRRSMAFGIGYERLAPDVLGAIWQDLCRAADGVCDITQFNPNAVLELGIAHAMGRPVLLITRDSDPHPHFAPIGTLRTHRYDATADPAALVRRVASFLDATPQWPVSR